MMSACRTHGGRRKGETQRLDEAADVGKPVNGVKIDLDHGLAII